MIDIWDDIQKLLRKQLLTVCSLPSEKNRAWEWQYFEPEEGEAWIIEKLLPGGERPTANNEISGVGIYQIDYMVPFHPSSTGYPQEYKLSNARKVADDIKHAFKPATTLGDGALRINDSNVGAAAQGGSWIQLPVRIQYTVFSTIN